MILHARKSCGGEKGIRGRGLLDAAKGLITTLKLCGIGEREALLSLVQVYKVQVAELTHLVDDVPGIILRHGHLIQLHVF